MSRHEDLSSKAVDGIQGFQPVQAVTIGDKQKLVGKKELAQIDNAILGNVYDAVPSRVSRAHIENLNFPAAEIQRDPIPKSLIRKSRFLLFGRHLLPLH